MWAQFMEHPDYQPFFGSEATVLYFKRGATYPGIPTEKRIEELKEWEAKLTDTAFLSKLRTDALQTLLDERAALQSDWIRIKGKTLSELIPFVQTKLTYSLYSLKRKLEYAKKAR
jgi:hypothetical protein